MQRPIAFFLAALLVLPSLGCKPDKVDLKLVKQQEAGEYTVRILSETGAMKKGTGSFTLEFRKTSDNQLVDVGKVEVSPVMDMSGMAPMMGGADVTPTSTPGRYEVRSNFTMAGLWKVNIKFGDDQSVRFSLNAA